MHLLDLKLFRFLASCRFPKAVPDHTTFSGLGGLVEQEADFFRENGYLVKKELVSESICQRIVDHAWEKFPKSFLRGRPETWHGKVKDCLCERTLKQRKGRVKFRECIRPEKWIKAAVCRHPGIDLTARSLLGEDRSAFIPYVRGLYPVFPSVFGKNKRPRPHTDGHPFVLGVLIYLEDVEADGGGFHVWPGSHLRMRHSYRFSAGPGWLKDYHQQLYGYALKFPAKEIVGPAGTVIFWHHRLAHAAGLNRSERIRQALLCDFRTSDLEEQMAKPVPDDPWEGWVFNASTAT